MKNQKELFEFLSQLIDIQIKKYVTLATEGVVSDSRINAKLVFAEINELLGFAERLITDMENPLEGRFNDRQHFSDLFNQVKFYLEQEHARAYAGWLLDENNSTEEVEKQLARLKQIGESAKINCSSESLPVTPIQKQCEYDSAQIAFQIFDFAKKIKEDPDMELDSTIPKQAQIRLRHNAKTRYCEEEFVRSIDGLHKIYTEFFEQSDLENSNSVLSQKETMAYEKQHRNQWKSLLKRYQAIASKLLSPDHTPSVLPAQTTIQITTPPTEEKPKDIELPSDKKTESGLVRNSIFYGGLAIVGAVAVYMLMSFFTKDNKSLNSIFKLE